MDSSHSPHHTPSLPTDRSTTSLVGAANRPGVPRTSSRRALVEATRGVLELSSQLILLPFRLMSIAFGLWGLHQLSDGSTKYDLAYKQHLRRSGGTRRSRTRDVLWLSSSPVADLSTSLLLLLIHNERYGTVNKFRTEFAGLSDNRWEDDGNDLPDLPDSDVAILLGGEQDGLLGDSFSESMRLPERASLPSRERRFSKGISQATTLTINFEGLFATFGSTLHTEPSALLLYTLLQTSPSFASSIAVRSDLDTLVLPLLRTFYFATSLRSHVAAQQDYQPRGGNSTHSAALSKATSARDCPFRSQSQLYVIIILLLLFSQDSSFGADAFRRVMVSSVQWYKERYLKDISLGSVLLLVLLRSLAFNLNRQNDAFLLSNCCAVLMNLSSSIVDLHDYAAMRLVSLTVTSMKRYLALLQENPNNDDDDLTTPTSMHGEAVRTLLCVLQHCLCRKSIDKNLHIVYALVYHQSDFNRLFNTKGTLHCHAIATPLWQLTQIALMLNATL
jgi:Dyggve-Melchior-Clausen syndrome protein